MSTSTILQLLIGLALIGNTIVGALPDKVIGLASKSTSTPATGPAKGPSGLSTTPMQTGAGISSPADTVPSPSSSSSSSSGLSIPGIPGPSPLLGAPGSGQ